MVTFFFLFFVLFTLYNMTEGWIKKPLGWEATYNFNEEHSSKDIILSEDIKDTDGIFVLAGGIDENGHCHSSS